MAKPEIERKFLLDPAPDPGHPLLAHATRSRIEQTYLSGGDERVRLVREEDGVERYTHTRKERVSALRRIEDEREIDRGEYTALLRRRDSERGTIRKTRYTFPHAAHTFELDLFEAPPGLALLEVELDAEDDAVELPPFTGLREVTSDEAYTNAELARRVG